MKEDSNWTRRDILKATGAAVATFAAAKLGVDRYKNNQEKHEKQGEAICVSKHRVVPKTILIGQMACSNSSEYWIIVVKMDSPRSKPLEFNVSKEEYYKYNPGDKIPVKYDDRDMEVKEILNTNKESK